MSFFSVFMRISSHFHSGNIGWNSGNLGSKGTLYNMLDEFVAKGILNKDEKVRNTTYYCPDILKLL